MASNPLYGLTNTGQGPMSYVPPSDHSDGEDKDGKSVPPSPESLTGTPPEMAGLYSHPKPSPARVVPTEKGESDGEGDYAEAIPYRASRDSDLLAPTPGRPHTALPPRPLAHTGVEPLNLTSQGEAPPEGAATGCTTPSDSPPEGTATGCTTPSDSPPEGTATGCTTPSYSPPEGTATGCTTPSDSPPEGAATGCTTPSDSPPGGNDSGDTTILNSQPEGTMITGVTTPTRNRATADGPPEGAKDGSNTPPTTTTAGPPPEGAKDGSNTPPTTTTPGPPPEGASAGDAPRRKKRQSGMSHQDGGTLCCTCM